MQEGLVTRASKMNWMIASAAKWTLCLELVSLVQPEVLKLVWLRSIPMTDLKSALFEVQHQRTAGQWAMRVPDVRPWWLMMNGAIESRTSHVAESVQLSQILRDLRMSKARHQALNEHVKNQRVFAVFVVNRLR